MALKEQKIKNQSSNKILKSFHVSTLGCKINLYESESIINSLIKKGYKFTKGLNAADIIIINTCTVTSKADAKTRNIIRKLYKNNKDSLIIVCGCIVNTDIEDLKLMNEVDIFIKNEDKDKIAFVIDNYYKGLYADKPYIFNSNLDGSFNFKISDFSRHSRAFLKIQDGCDNFCSYCKIPLARGNSRSRSIDEIFNEIETLQKNGFEEVVLSGINLGSYNYNNNNFSEFLYKLISEFKDIRFRLSSIELEYINNEFIDLARYKNICPHFHIPLQSGSDKILRLMNRKYTVESYIEKISYLRKSKENPFISTDLIFGFPGEDDNDFNKIINVINHIKFSFIHLFGYSPRKGTEAYNLKPKIAERIRDERIKIIRNIVEEFNLKYRKSYLNKELEVVVERENGLYYTGKSENYISLMIDKKITLYPKKRYNVILKKIIENNNFCILSKSQ